MPQHPTNEYRRDDEYDDDGYADDEQLGNSFYGYPPPGRSDHRDDRRSRSPSRGPHRHPDRSSGRSHSRRSDRRHSPSRRSHSRSLSPHYRSPNGSGQRRPTSCSPSPRQLDPALRAAEPAEGAPAQAAGEESPEPFSWHNVDAAGSLQGPFATEQMRTWFTEGYFAAETRVAPSHNGEKPQELWPISTLWQDPAREAFAPAASGA